MITYWWIDERINSVRVISFTIRTHKINGSHAFSNLMVSNVSYQIDWVFFFIFASWNVALRLYCHRCKNSWIQSVCAFSRLFFSIYYINTLLQTIFIWYWFMHHNRRTLNVIPLNIILIWLNVQSQFVLALALVSHYTSRIYTTIARIYRAFHACSVNFFFARNKTKSNNRTETTKRQKRTNKFAKQRRQKQQKHQRQQMTIQMRERASERIENLKHTDLNCPCGWA